LEERARDEAVALNLPARWVGGFRWKSNRESQQGPPLLSPLLLRRRGGSHAVFFRVKSEGRKKAEA